MREYGVVRWNLGATKEEVEASKPYLGQARVQLGIMKNLMALGNQQQGTRAVTLPDGTVIRSQSVMGQDTVQITPTVAAVAAVARQQQEPPARMKQGGYAVVGAVWADAEQSYTVPAIWYSATRRITVVEGFSVDSAFLAAAPGLGASTIQYGDTTRAIRRGQYTDYENIQLDSVSNRGDIFAGFVYATSGGLQSITVSSATGTSAEIGRAHV